MKSYARGLALAGAAVLMLTACSSASSSTAAGTASSGSTPVTLTLWTGFTGPDRPAYEGIVKQWNDTHPDIQVTMDVQPWDAIGQKLPSAWATGQGPDLATPNFDPGVIFQYVKTNSVLPLDDATGDGDGKINTSAFPDSVTKAFTVDGKLYAVPANVATLVLYYNKKLLSAAGLQPPTTADQFLADAKTLTKSSGGKVSQYGIALADHATIQMWPILQWMNGGDIVDAKGCSVISDKPSVDALTAWSDAVRTDQISPVGLTGADADTLFSSQKAAMEMNGPWAAAGFKSAGVDLGIADIPVGPAGPVTLASTVPLMIGKGTAHPAEAKQFLAFWTSKTAQGPFSTASGFPPVRTDMASDIASNPVVSQFASALPHARLYLPGLATSAQIDANVYVPLIQKITRDGGVASAADDAKNAINQLTGCTQ